MCWIFHETLSIWLPIRFPLKKNCVCLMKSLKNMPGSLETMTDSVPTQSTVVKIFYHWGDTGGKGDGLICVLINTSAPSHWLKSVSWSVSPVLNIRQPSPKAFSLDPLSAQSLGESGRVNAFSASIPVTSQVTVESRNDRAENAWGLGYSGLFIQPRWEIYFMTYIKRFSFFREYEIPVLYNNISTFISRH